jgi:GT2 family glycosyltransferase
MFYLWHDDLRPGDETRATIPVFWAGGGSCAIDRNKCLAIGGFDSLYHPFYVEDVDLSYQAWKRGWKCLLAPGSRVVHKHRSTTSARFGEGFVENTVRQNQYLFFWKNVTDVLLMLRHLANLPRIHARGMFNHTPSFEVRAFLRAMRRLPEALRKRVNSASQYVINDREVLARSQKP